jgi:membrane fusion protein, copper/silver efflux system
MNQIDALISLVKETGATSGDIHLVHCPMAFEFKGSSLLQKNKSVANPYFGSEMFSCGHVQQSFSAKK